jgi:6-phosphogluconolactonase (cycloisomerase 2 family)
LKKRTLVNKSAMRMLARCWSFVVVMVLGSVPFARAAALDFVQVAIEGQDGVNGLAGVLAVAVSPDGRNVYAVGPSSDTLAVFARDAATGALTQLETQKDGFGGVDGLAGASALVVSPDGAHVYVVGMRDDAVAAFVRDPETGALTFLEAQKEGTAGVEGLRYARAIAISPDGAFLYAAGQLSDAIAVFKRNGLTGWLTFVEVQRQGTRGVDGIAGPLALAVSPDGAHLYAASGDQSAVTVFARDKATGRLTLREVEADQGNDLGISGIHSVAVSPDGDFVYATGQNDDAVAIFRRNRRTGMLTFTEVVAQGLDGVDGLYGALWVTVSPDGKRVYVASTIDNAVAAFDRDRKTGGLTFLQKAKGAPGRDCLAFARGVAVSPDGTGVYVAGASSNAVVVFRAGDAAPPAN